MSIMDKGDQSMTKENTLVQYLPPILIGDEDGPVKRQLIRHLQLDDDEFSTGFPTLPEIPGLLGLSLPSQDCTYSKKEMIEILERMFPTREWTEIDRKVWKQKISPNPASRDDIINLVENLEMKLELGQARSVGISPVRHYLVTQAFYETIRQMTIASVRHGIFLVRISDELHLTLTTYQKLYESGIEYGVRKVAQVETEEHGLHDKIKEQKKKNENLRARYQELKREIDLGGRSNVEDKKQWMKRRADEMWMLKRSNQQLKILLDSIIKQ